MSKHRVLLTDYAWPDLEIERAILAGVDAVLVVAEGTEPAALAALAARHRVDGIMTNWASVTEEVIGASENLRIVSRLGIGLDNIDIACCTRLGIPVTNVPDYCLVEVVEHALALILSLGRKVAFYHHAAKCGRYQLQAGPVMRRIEGQTLGIVGFGNIGRRLAEKALGLGLKVVAADPHVHEMLPGVEPLGLAELLARSDYVSLHLPLVAETRHLLGRDELALMKPTAYLINTARGGLVDPDALAAALAEDRLAGAALDVQEPEPPDLTKSPYNDARAIVTPHASFLSAESLEDLRTRTARQIAARLSGDIPENVVNGVL